MACWAWRALAGCTQAFQDGHSSTSHMSFTDPSAPPHHHHPQVAFLRQQLAQLRGENASLRAALAAEGREGSLEGGPGSPGCGHWAVMQKMEEELSGLELDNTRFKMQLVGAGCCWDVDVGASGLGLGPGPRQTMSCHRCRPFTSSS